MSLNIFRKSECVYIFCRIFCVLMILAQAIIVLKIIFCMNFTCLVIEKHVFYGISLLLQLFEAYQEEANSKAAALRYFYIYIVVVNSLSIILYGVVSTSPTTNVRSKLIDNLFFLGIVICMCIVMLLQNSAVLMLIIFIGLDRDIGVQTEATFLSVFEALQAITLSLLLAVFNLRHDEMLKEKSLLFSVTLVQHTENEDPVLVL